MKEIVLTHGRVALVDDEDFDTLNQWKWCLKAVNNPYAVRLKHLGMDGAKQLTTQLRMHRIVMSCPKGMDVDHINGDTLDNRKENLRICTHRQNCQNTKIRTGASSKYKGVMWDKRSDKWLARIVINGKQKRLGLFNCEIAAACMYNASAKKYFGEYARLNVRAD